MYVDLHVDEYKGKYIRWYSLRTWGGGERMEHGNLLFQMQLLHYKMKNKTQV